MLISSDFFPLSLAILRRFCKGSAPTDRIKVKGILFIVSVNIYCIVGDEASTNDSPIDYLI